MAETCHHNCLEELSAEHKTILEQLEELEKNSQRKIIDKDGVENFLDFTESFIEPHLQKEEKVLFPALEQKGMPKEGGPIGVMLFEHEIKRGYVKELEKALKENKEKDTRENAEKFISLLREHINKEENVLYPLAKDVLTKNELVNLGHQCEKIKGN